MESIIHNILEKVESYKSAGDMINAKKVLETAIVSSPNEFRLYEELCDLFLFFWENEKAKNALSFARELAPDSATGLYLEWYIAILEDRFSDAITSLEASNEKSPNNPEVLRNLGWSYTMIGEIRKGIVVLGRALSLNPDDDLIIEDLGMALLSEWNTAEAHDLLKKIWKEKNISDFS